MVLGMFRHITKNWKGEQTRKVKRGFATKRDAFGMGSETFIAAF